MAELPSTEKVINTYRQVTIYYRALEELAGKYQTGKIKSRCAFRAVEYTVKFLQGLNVDRSLCAALIEAQEIIEREIEGGRTEKKQEMERDVVDCLALFHQRRCRVKPKDALRAIVGNDPAAQSHLENFNKKMMARWRWSKDPELGFPKPIKIKNRLLYRRSEIEAFERRITAASTQDVK